MPKCPKCGSDIGENVRFCTNCGTPVNAPKPEEKTVPRDNESVEIKPETQTNSGFAPVTPPEQQNNAPQYVPQPQFNAPPEYYQPQQQTNNASQQYGQNTYNAPGYTPVPEMNVWNHFVTLFLISLPIAGFIIYLVWLFGGSKYRQRVNFIRGHLIFSVIVTLIISLIVWASYGVISVFVDNVLNEVNEQTGRNYGSFEDFFENGGENFNYDIGGFDY